MKLLKYLFLFLPIISFSQQAEIDSLKKVLLSGQEDTNKVNTLNSLSRELVNTGDYANGLIYANNAFELAAELNFKKGTAKAKNNMGNIYLQQGNYPEALKEFFSSLKIREEIGDKYGIASSHNNIGNIYLQQGNYPEALKEHFSSLKIFEEIGDKYGIATSHNNIGNIYDLQGNYPEALKEHFSSLKIKEEIGDKKGIAASHNNIGIIYYRQGNYPEALKEYFSSLKLKEEIGDKKGIATSHNNIGNIYKEQGNYPEALKEFISSLKIREETGDKHGIAASHNNIGEVYIKQNKAGEGKKELETALGIGREIGNKETIKYSYSGLSAADSALGNYKSAYENYKMYIVYRDSLLSEENTKKTVQSQMQYEFDKKEGIAKAEQEKKDAIVEEEKRRQKLFLFSVVGGLLLVLVFAGFIFRSLRISNKQKQIIEVQKQEVADAFKNIETVSAIGQKITATLNLEEVIDILHRHINNVMDASAMVIYIYNKDTNSLDIKYAMGKHKDLIAKSIPMDSEDSFCVWSLRNKKEVLVNDIEKDHKKYLSKYYWSSIPDSEIIQSFINIPLIIGNNAIGVISVQSFNKNVYSKEDLEVLKSLASFMSAALNNADAYSQLNMAKENLTEQKLLVEEKNKDITDSINYARRIQRAMLPHRRDIWAAFSQSFVLYKPKAIVSGDFYFFAPAPVQTVHPGGLKGGKAGSSFFIAACDCTGHGVPGAFMSMVGAGKLTDSVAQSSDTSEVLSLLNIGVKTALKQSEEDQSATRDGMDIALCSVDTEKRVVKYAGANRPIWIIRKGSSAVEEIKATKKAIGGFTENTQHFDTHEIKLSEGDTFYLSTDGYADTFGKDGKKMMTKRFKEILLGIQDKTMKEQEKHLDEFVENWKGGAEQVDDILVIGIRV